MKILDVCRRDNEQKSGTRTKGTGSHPSGGVGMHYVWVGVELLKAVKANDFCV